MRYLFIFLMITIATLPKVFGQVKTGILIGKVTFVTSQNIYVSFDNTKLISIGDTLQLSRTKSNCLIVTNKSSSSCVCKKTENCDIKKDDIVVFKYVETQSAKKPKTIKSQQKDTISNVEKIKNTKTNSKSLENISGSFSVASYSNIYNIRDNNHRMMSRFTLYADHIANSKFSFETYLNYNKDIFTPKNTSSYYSNQGPFKVYDLALKYDATPTLSISVGRKINNFISSIGAIDGLQVEKHFGKNYVGVITGFRPDIYTYGFNSNLFQYGAYFGRRTQTKNITSQTTIGLIEQRNSGQVDRRYTYFQHSSSLFNKVNLFGSAELDIYSKLPSGTVAANSLRLTNFYVSARYKFSRQFNAVVSFDSRKNVIYYQTFQTEIERLLADDISRQGLRLRINTRPLKYVNAGFSISQRFQSDNLNKSSNLNGYVSLYKIPNIGGSISANYNQNTSNYLTSNILSFRYSRSLFKDKLYADFYYRHVNYNYTSSNTLTKQNYYGSDLSLNISRSLRFSLSAEYLKSDLEHNYRINTRLVKRFNTKKRKH